MIVLKRVSPGDTAAAPSRSGGEIEVVVERVWGGKIDPKFDCHYFDPICAAGGAVSQGPAAGGAVSQGPVGAQRREAQPAGDAEKQWSVPFSALCEIVKTKCSSFEWQLTHPAHPEGLGWQD